MKHELLILGNINVDLIMGPLQHWPQEGTETLLPHLEWRVGGNAGNAIVAAEALGTDWMSRSLVGKDLAGDWLRQQLPNVDWLHSSTQTSLSVAVTHPNGERSFLSHLGHLESMRWQDLETALPDARMALLAGAFLTPGLRAQYPAILKQFAASQTTVAADFGWPDEGFTEAVQQEVSGWLPHLQHLLINELEAQHLSGQDSTPAALHTLAGLLHPEGTVVIKCGALGVMAQQQSKQYTQAAPQVSVLDSVGAGDTWNAAYLHALLHGEPLEAALSYAVQVASTAISTSPRQFRPQNQNS